MTEKKFKKAVLISIEKIKPNSWNPNEMDQDTFEHLMNDINENGFGDPITVRPIQGAGPYEYEIVDGEQRFTAAVKLGYLEVPCFIEEVDDFEARVLTIRRNKERGAFNPLKLAENILFLQKRFNAKQLEKMIGFKEAELKDYLKLLDLPSDIKAMIKAQKEHEQKIMPMVMQFVVTAEDEKLINIALSKKHAENRAEALKILCEDYLTPEEKGLALKKIVDFFNSVESEKN